eukprot:3094334-Pleurochrysis_carterae.AAC.2
MLKAIKQISYMELDLRDSKGRKIPLIAAGQNTDRNRSFEAFSKFKRFSGLGHTKDISNLRRMMISHTTFQYPTARLPQEWPHWILNKI